MSQRPFWSWIKKIGRNGDDIPKLYHKNKAHTSSREKTNALNDYFQSVFTKEITGNLQQLKRKLVGERCQQSIELVTFSEDQVYDELSSIDITKASGPEELHGRLLKEAAPYIARSLSQLFAKSM